MSFDAYYAVPAGEPIEGDQIASDVGWCDWGAFVMARADRFPECAQLALAGRIEGAQALRDLVSELHHARAEQEGDEDLAGVTDSILAAVSSAPEKALGLIVSNGVAPSPFEGEGVSRESIFREEHGPPPFKGAVFNTSTHRWEKPDGAGGDGGRGTGDRKDSPDLPDSEKQSLETEAEKAVPEELAKANPGIVHKVKQLALKAAIAGLSVIETLPQAAWNLGHAIYELADNVLDTVEDVSKKLGYNPTSSGVAGHATTSDAFKTGFADLTGMESPISGHIAAKLASTLIVKFAYWAASKLRGSKAEAVEGDGVADWANLLSQLFTHLNEQFGLDAGAPDKDAVAASLRNLLGAK